MKKLILIIMMLCALLLCACGGQNEDLSTENDNSGMIDQQTYDLSYKAITTVDSYNNDEITLDETVDQLYDLQDQLNTLTDTFDNDWIKSNNLTAAGIVENIWFAFSQLQTIQSKQDMNQSVDESEIDTQLEAIDTNTKELVDFLNDHDIFK